MITSKITDTKRYDSSMETLIFKIPTSTFINTIDYNSFLTFIDLNLLSNASGAKLYSLQPTQGYNKFKIFNHNYWKTAFITCNYITSLAGFKGAE